MRHHPAWSDFETGEALDLSAWPHLDGIPVLVPEPHAFLARHGPRTTPAAWALQTPHDPLPVDAPDPLTPHLPPDQWPAELRPDGTFGDWLGSLSGICPDAVCAAWGAALAPPGPALDAGCGVGGMARRMAAHGRPTTAFDRAPDAVRLAQSTLLGRLSAIPISGARSQEFRHPWPLGSVGENSVQWAIADVLAPPLPAEAFSWIHLGNVVDMVDAGPAAVVDAVAPLLASGALLTLATPHDEDAVPRPNAPDPADLLRETLHALGLDVVAENRCVPWVVRQYDRGYRVLLTDCIAARASW